MNTWVQNNKNWLTKNYDITHQYGGKNTITIEKQENYHPIAFIQENYAQILAEADIVIARSGANTLAELGHFNTSCILVPYPYAAGNHQQHNAQEFIEQNERSLMILDKNIEKDLKKEQIEKLISKTNSSESQKQNNSPVNTIQHSFLK
ncbi:MAG: glycosyltransferase [Patescibacteria group bacterium]|nr:glycosyltransferase [Patescibacteria group bacterium]